MSTDPDSPLHQWRSIPPLLESPVPSSHHNSTNTGANSPFSSLADSELSPTPGCVGKWKPTKSLLMKSILGRIGGSSSSISKENQQQQSLAIIGDQEAAGVNGDMKEDAQNAFKQKSSPCAEDSKENLDVSCDSFTARMVSPAHLSVSTSKPVSPSSLVVEPASPSSSITVCSSPATQKDASSPRHSDEDVMLSPKSRDQDFTEDNFVPKSLNSDSWIPKVETEMDCAGDVEVGAKIDRKEVRRLLDTEQDWAAKKTLAWLESGRLKQTVIRPGLAEELENRFESGRSSSLPRTPLHTWMEPTSVCTSLTRRVSSLSTLQSRPDCPPATAVTPPPSPPSVHSPSTPKSGFHSTDMDVSLVPKSSPPFSVLPGISKLQQQPDASYSPSLLGTGGRSLGRRNCVIVQDTRNSKRLVEDEASESGETSDSSIQDRTDLKLSPLRVVNPQCDKSLL